MSYQSLDRILNASTEAFDKVTETSTKTIKLLLEKLNHLPNDRKINVLVAMIKSPEYKDAHLVALATIAVVTNQRFIN